MPRFGKYQSYLSQDLQAFGQFGKIYSGIVGYTQLGGFGQFCWFRKILTKIGLPLQSVLDAGCGMGEYAFWFSETFPGSQVDAIDVDPFRIEACSQLQEKLNMKNTVHFHCLDIAQLQERKKYDLIICIDVLEHLPETKDVLDCFWNALKPGGFCYLRLPTEHQDRLFDEKHFLAYNRWEHYEGVNKDHINPLQSLSSLWEVAKNIGFQKFYATHTNGKFAKMGFELGIISENISRILYALAIPMLKGLYRLDSLVFSGEDGNGFILVLEKPVALNPGERT